MKIVCDSCSTKYSIADEKVRGKVFKIRCKKCSHVIVVRGTDGEAAEAPGHAERAVAARGAGGAPAGTASGTGAAGGWHVVLAGKQAGPFAMDDIRRMADTGEIDADTYAWRDGFGDWQKISAIDEIAAVLPIARRGASPFQDGGRRSSADDDFAPQADPFSSAKPVATARAVRRQNAQVEAGNDASAEPAYSEPAAAPAMTGQRNENSVLFSLANLAQLASGGAPKAQLPGMQSGDGGDGSGLIDIRAMAAGATGRADGGGAFGALPRPDEGLGWVPGQYQAASAVLLPTMQSNSNNRMLYAVVGLLGLVSVAVIVLVVMLARGSSGSSDKNQVASAGAAALAATTPSEGGEGAAPGAEGAGGAAAGGAAVAAGGAGAAAAGGAAVAAGAAGAAAAGGAAVAAGAAAAAGVATATKVATVPKEKMVATKVTPPQAPKETLPPKEVVVASRTPKVATNCTEVTCAIDNYPSGCCDKFRKKKEPAAVPTGGSSTAGLPASLAREDIKAGIAAVKGRVEACNQRYKEPGTVMVKIAISNSGSVVGAQTEGTFAGTPTGSCVEKAVQQAKFKKFGGANMNVKYPFIFR